jgi:periodic tryptophan protein 1
LLATASADTTIKLWDLNNNTRALQSYEFHSSKVSQIIFNNFDNRILLSGGHDQLATCFDTRSVDSVLRFELESDVEVLKWDPVVAERFYIATEDGNLKCYDTRNKQTVYCINAHDSACSALDLSSIHSGLLVTGSSDRTVKIWSILNDLPKCLVSRDLGCGKVFTAEFSTDEEYVLAVSGSGGKLVVWNLVDNEIVRNAFPSKTVFLIVIVGFGGMEKK